MRQSNQKSRSRGRGRKPQNPMSRNFESNGPDVKIRGNAAHIAEKYSALARDCLSNGDRVIAENYLQHAEHYNRIVAAAQQQSEARAAEIAAKNAQNEAENQNSENAEAAATNGKGDGEEKANGKAESVRDNDNVEADAAPKERKNSRNRRPRKQPAADATQNSSTKSENSEEPEVAVEAISDDAAKLPGSLLGEMVAEEG